MGKAAWMRDCNEAGWLRETHDAASLKAMTGLPLADAALAAVAAEGAVLVNEVYEVRGAACERCVS